MRVRCRAEACYARRMKKILLSTAFAVSALVIGCSSSSETAPASDAGADASKADAGRDAGGAPPVSDAGPASQGTDGSVTSSDAGSCGFTTAGPAEAYTGSDDNGDPLWIFFGQGTDSALSIENYVGFGGPSAPGTVTLRTEDESYETCGLCIVLRTGCSTTSCEKTFMPIAGQGSVTITEMGAEGGNFRGSFSGLQFRQVTIDPQSNVTTPVSADAGASTACLSGVSFEGLLDDVANAP